ncbi:MAG: hypothetical protein BYD32DRAFT_832 [Podila humilis]|nr:MAG: hypothetical protein BYD32DRAFT_832 [Podila humilis]
MTTASASVFEFHPLVESICLNFTPHDLTCCVVVSSAWNTSFSPFLWRRIRLYNEYNYARFNSPLALAAVARLCSLVQIVETNNPRLLDLFDDSYSFLNLSTLRVSQFGLSAGAFVQLVSRCTNLQTLELLSYFDQQEPIVEQFLAILQSRPRLRKLVVLGGLIPTAMVRRLLLSCGNLEKIDIGLYPHLTELPLPTPKALLDEVQELTGSESPSFKVTDLKISCYMELGEPYCSFLQMCPNVTRFAMPVMNISSKKKEPYPSVLKSTMKKLRHLKLYTTASSMEITAGHIIACTNLESYIDPEYMPSSEPVTTALSRHCNTLTVIELRGFRLFWRPTEAVHTLLCTCPSLQRFSAKGTETYEHMEEVNSYWMTSLWISSNLKALEIDFGSRLVETEEPERGERELEYVPEFLVLQLGRMAKLEEISLRRVVAVGKGPVTDMRTMPTEHYETSRKQVSLMLTTLSTLPELRRVEFQGMQGAMDTERVDNAKQHWKHIKIVRYHEKFNDDHDEFYGH